MHVEGRVALITGAERGLGRALAVALARRGARVIASGLNQEALESLRTTIEAVGAEVRAFACDVRDRRQIAAVVNAVEAACGGVDLLVNNAGITLGGDIRVVTEKDWDAVLDVNLRGAVRMVDAVLPGMLARGRGHIVNIASAAGLAAPALWIPYAASKFALVGFSEGLRAALHARGIAVSVACPMWIRTDMLTSAKPQLAEPLPRDSAPPRTSTAWRWLAARARGRGMAQETAAHRIVRGIERRRFMIYTHRSTHLLVAARALAPGLFAYFWRRVNELDEDRHRHATPE